MNTRPALPKTKRPKPPHPFCWVCSRKLWGNAYRLVSVDGVQRVVHVACVEEALP